MIKVIPKLFLSPFLSFSLCHKHAHTHTHTHITQIHKSHFISSILFFIASVLLQDFLQSQTHIARISFRFSETQGSTVDSIYGLLLLSRTPEDSKDVTVLKSFISSSVYLRTIKISYSKENILHSSPLTKNLLVPTSR